MTTSDQGKAAGVKAALEAFAGHTIDASTDQLEEQLRLTFVFPFSTYSIAPNTPDPSGDNVGNVVTRNLIVFRPNSCTQTELLDVSAFAVIPDTGNTTLRLKRFLCPDDAHFFAAPINIVATSVSATPIFATVTHSFIFDQFNNAIDVEFQIFAWDAEGAPAPNVTVDWRCRVPVFIIIE
jgi:hypothetical protein